MRSLYTKAGTRLLSQRLSFTSLLHNLHNLINTYEDTRHPAYLKATQKPHQELSLSKSGGLSMSPVNEQFPKKILIFCRVVLALPVMVEGKAINRGQAHEEAGPRYSPLIAQKKFPSALILR